MNKKYPPFLIAVVIVSFFLIPNPSRADVPGQKESFFVDPDFDKYNRSQLSATLRYVSDKLYFYVEDSYWNGLDMVHQNSLVANITVLAEEFDERIYPEEIQFWGSEANPGVDSDPRITILVEQLDSSNGGYFNTANGYTYS